MGMGATNVMDRVAVSIGILSDVPVAFNPCMDVSCGGVLLALPALLEIGLLRHTGEFFSLPRGYYGLWSIFTLLAFMAYDRIVALLCARGVGQASGFGPYPGSADTAQ
jgi:hypothetical protein